MEKNELSTPHLLLPHLEFNLNILSAVYRVILFMVNSSQRASFLAPV